MRQGKVQLLAAAAIGGFIVWSAPTVNAWIRGAPTSAQQICLGHAERAGQFGALVVACLNGEGLTDGERTVGCREIR